MGHWSVRESWNRAKAVGERGEAKDLKVVEEVEQAGFGEELACKRWYREVVNSMVPWVCELDGRLPKLGDLGQETSSL